PPPPTDPTVETEADVETDVEAPVDDATIQDDAQAPMATADAEAEADVIDVLRAEGQFTTLVSALEAVGLDTVIESTDGITILAPTDEAFAALPEGELDRLMQEENAEELRDL